MHTTAAQTVRVNISRMVVNLKEMYKRLPSDHSDGALLWGVSQGPGLVAPAPSTQACFIRLSSKPSCSLSCGGDRVTHWLLCAVLPSLVTSVTLSGDRGNTQDTVGLRQSSGRTSTNQEEGRHARINATRTNHKEGTLTEMDDLSAME